MNIYNEDKNLVDSSKGKAFSGRHRREQVANNALIENIFLRNRNGYVTISYGTLRNDQITNMHVVTLIVGRETRLRDQFGNRISLRALREGMVINARFSMNMTRSRPPQSRAFSMTIIKEDASSLIDEGRVIKVDVFDNHGYILTGDPNNINRQIKYVVSNTTKLRGRQGNRIKLREIRPKDTVKIERASFQTASIPPQTQALTVQIIRR